MCMCGCKCVYVCVSICVCASVGVCGVPTQWHLPLIMKFGIRSGNNYLVLPINGAFVNCDEAPFEVPTKVPFNCCSTAC